jgi:hypothetical protein
MHMRIDRLLLSTLLSAALGAACQSKPASPPPAPDPVAPAAGGMGGAVAAAPAAPPAQALIHGKIAEKLDAAGYTYLKLQTAGGEVWAAVPVAAVTVGSEVDVTPQMTMEAFESKGLNRKFDKLVFATLGGGAPPAGAGAGSLPPNHPPMGGAAGGMGGMPGAPGGEQLPPNHPPMGGAAGGASAGAPSAGGNPHAGVGTSPPSNEPIKVAKASGKEGRTVAEVFAQKDKLKDVQVSIRGKVVKYNQQILGKNWIHLKDGTGAAGSDDLTITTEAQVAVGDVVLVSGKVHLDKDFGAGYAYNVIVEDATVQPAK